MSKRLFFILPVLLFAGLFCFFLSSDSGTPANISELRATHAEFLKNQALEKEKDISRLNRIRQGLPPNPYYHMMEYLTMNPALGHPEPYKVRDIYKDLLQNRRSRFKAPGGPDSQPWISRGPDNVGGRTRVLLFDPNDASGKRVFAGAVSGGLWVNNDITSESSTWEHVSGLSSNLNITCLTVDPNDQNTWYVGTGESYTGGDVIGTGVYKTSDGGQTWEQVLDVKDFETSTQNTSQRVVGGIFYINDIQAWDNGNSTEVFIGVSTHLYANAQNPDNFLGFFDRGLYRSVNGGAEWEQLIEEKSFNDFEVDANGNLWVATTYSFGEGEDSRGGDIYKREQGPSTSFEYITTIPDVKRTEIEASATDPNKFYIAAENTDNEADLFITTDAFSTVQKLNEPNDVDLDIPASDFTRGQAFYDLVIEADPNNDNIVYAGGINLFRSTDSGNSWNQISKWSNNPNLDNLPVSIVHADQHVISFRPGNSNQAVFGHDGGVSFATDLSRAGSSKVFFSPLNKYITTQFYSIAVAPTSFANGDHFLGGTQDNGTQLILNGDRESIGILGGDGAHSFFDQVDPDYLVANVIYNNLIVAYDFGQEGLTLIANNEDRDGFFINPQALDSNLDKLYSNGPEGVLYRYEDLTDLDLIGDDLTDDDQIAPRVSLTNSLLSTSISALAVSPFNTNSSTVLVGLIDGKLLKIENADGPPSQATYSQITGSQFVGSISDIEYGNSEDEIMVTFYNFGVRNIWYTENGTAANPTWVSKEGNLPDLPVLCILKNPLNPDEVIIGTELGVWATQNFSSNNPTWAHSYNGMSDVKVTDMDIKKGTNEVYAASYGRGMFTGQFTTAPSPGGGETDPNKVFVYPVVTDGNFNILSGKTLGATDVMIFDISGQLIQSQRVDLQENVPQPVELNSVASGVYFVKIKSSSKESVQKIVRK
jgi:photosystem II stability/assembly factor-like uncharacterized protein